MASDSSPALWWARRDLRLADNPALRAAIDEGIAVLPLFVLDPTLLRSAGHARKAWLLAALHALDSDLRQAGGPGLSLIRGRPASAVHRVAKACGAASVHISADFAPYGRARDQAVQRELARSGIELRRTGSPYAVAPGTLTNGSGDPFQVFSPFHRAWLDHGVHDPAPAVRPGSVDWLTANGQDTLEAPDPELAPLAGEKPAWKAWRAWLHSERVNDYDRLHDFPGPDATSHLSIALRWGHLHPRTVLSDLAPLRSKGATALARQIAWRDFFADTLFHR
ncbi:MAG TPA: deoxyribodipyrimidine photo-lyase, partial [Propionibacteriaceae bacterium]|nr:deoxyribodipyrimidine photo-lyase [Propionibacteriaceae bacterium]